MRQKYIDVSPRFSNRIPYILMTHSHWDHLGDTPEIIKRIGGAVFFGSRAAAPDLPVMELEVLKRYDLPRLP